MNLFIVSNLLIHIYERDNSETKNHILNILKTIQENKNLIKLEVSKNVKVELERLSKISKKNKDKELRNIINYIL